MFATYYAGIMTLIPTSWPTPLWVGVLTLVAIAVLKNLATVVAEEVVFHGFFIQSIAPSRWAGQAVSISAVMFGMMRLTAMVGSGVDLSLIAVGIFTWNVFGYALGTAFVRAGGSLWLPMAIHYGYNLVFSFREAFTLAIAAAPMYAAYTGPAMLLGQSGFVPECGLVDILLQAVIVTGVSVAIRGGVVSNRGRWH
ncbi:MAG: CPBP family intramembrane glutamic endopeptidase [Candidatus Thorarchaeota archaeon]